MLSQHSLKKLVEYLVKINQTEKLLETLRQNFCRNSYFQLQTCFGRFDKFSKGYLMPSDLSEFMLENKIYPSEDQLYMVFRDFDKTKQGVITNDRFEEEMLPKENAQLLKDVLKRKFYPPSLRLEVDLEFQIAKYFQSKLDSYITLNNIRIDLFKDGTFTTSKAFTLLDQNKKGIIETKEDIDAFLRSNSKLCKSEELRRIYEGLNFRRQGPITFERFDQHLDPLGRGFYPAYEQRLKERIQMKAIHELNLSTQQRLRDERQRNLLEESMLAHNYLRLRESNQCVNRVIQNQELEKEVIYRTRADENLRRSRELLRMKDELLLEEQLRAKKEAISRSLYRPYLYY